jgi:hypothetical protein
MNTDKITSKRRNNLSLKNWNLTNTTMRFFRRKEVFWRIRKGIKSFRKHLTIIAMIMWRTLKSHQRSCISQYWTIILQNFSKHLQNLAKRNSEGIFTPKLKKPKIKSFTKEAGAHLAIYLQHSQFRNTIFQKQGKTGSIIQYF